MTTVFLHGKLAREYGKKFTFSLGKPKDAVFAIDANKKGFMNRIIELSRQGAHYSIVADGKTINQYSGIKKAKEIHIVPTIVGSAGTVAAIGVILYGLAITSPGWLPQTLIPVLLAVGAAAISFGITNLLQKDNKVDVGSASATANALNKSFAFSNGDNVTEQGNPVAIGYGRLRIGSSVIQSTIKSFPAKFDEKDGLPIYSEFTELATKKGLSNMAILDSQSSSQTTV